MRPTIALGSSPELFAPISESRRCQISQRTKKIYKKTTEALVRLLCSGDKALPLDARPYIASSPSSPLLHLLDRLRDIVLQLHYNGGPGQWDVPPYTTVRVFPQPFQWVAFENSRIPHTKWPQVYGIPHKLLLVMHLKNTSLIICCLILHNIRLFLHSI